MAISIWIFGAALNGLLAVAAGAAASHIFGDDAHAVRLMSIGAQYAMYHALALLALAALAARTEGPARGLAVAAWLFLAGTVLFSGSLYLLAFTGLGAFASVTPVGGELRRRRAQLVQHQLHPQLGRLMDDDEQHLVMLVGDRVLAIEQLVEAQIVAIAHRRAEIDMRLDVGIAAGRRCCVLAALHGFAHSAVP